MWSSWPPYRATHLLEEGVEPSTLWFIATRSANWATPAWVQPYPQGTCTVIMITQYITLRTGKQMKYYEIGSYQSSLDPLGVVYKTLPAIHSSSIFRLEGFSMRDCTRWLCSTTSGHFIWFLLHNSLTIKSTWFINAKIICQHQILMSVWDRTQWSRNEINITNLRPEKW